MSPLGFKTRVGSLICTLEEVYVSFTSDVTLLPVHIASLAASRFPKFHRRYGAGLEWETSDLALRHANQSATAPIPGLIYTW